MATKYGVSTVFKGVDRMSKILKGISRNGVSSFGKVERATKKANRANGLFSGGLKSVLLRMVSISAIIAMVTMGLRGMTTTGIAFGKTMTRATAKFVDNVEKGSDRFKELQKTALQVGRTTEFTAMQAGQGLEYLAMAGFKSAEAMSALPTVVDVATASGVDLARATDIATDSLGAFGMIVDDPVQKIANMKRVMDVMAKTTNIANVDMDQLFETVKKGAPLAEGAGVSLEQFAAAAALMSTAVKGELAGTHLKNIFVSLQAPTKAATKHFRKLGIALTDQSGNLRDITDIFGDLEKKLPKTAERGKMLKDMFGKIPLASVNVLLNAGSEKWKDYTKQLEGATGYSKTLAETIRDDLSGDLDSMKSAAEGLGLALFVHLQEPLRFVVQSVTALTRGITSLVEWWGGLNPIVHDFAKVLMGVVVAYKAYTMWATILTAAQTALTVATGAFATVLSALGIGLIIIAISALITAVIWLVKNWDLAKEKTVGFFNSLKEKFQALPGWAQNVIAILVPVVNLVRTIGFLKQHWGTLTAVVKTFWGVIKGGFLLGLEKIKAFFTTGPGLIGGLKKAFQLLLNPVDALVSAIGLILKGWMKLNAISQKLPGFRSSDGEEGGSGSGEVSGSGLYTPAKAQAAISREERIERRENNATLTIQDNTGRAEMQGSLGAPVVMQTAALGV